MNIRGPPYVAQAFQPACTGPASKPTLIKKEIPADLAEIGTSLEQDGTESNLKRTAPEPITLYACLVCIIR